MNRVINGSRYDTTTAKMLGKAYAKCLPSDFSYWGEELYRTKSGKYFLHGEGGPQTRYASTKEGGTIGWGERIIPMSEENARKWAEEHLDGDRYEILFGEISEESTRIAVSLPAAVVGQLDAKCDELHVSRAEIISRALRSYLSK